MLFQVNLEKGMLLGAISADDSRDLYWGALSLAKYLQLKSPYTFARTHATTVLEDIEGMHGPEIYSRRELETRLMSHHDVLHFLASSHYEREKLVHYRLSTHDFYVRMKNEDMFFPIVEICSRSDPLAMEFKKWIRIAERMVLRNDENMMDEDMVAEWNAKLMTVDSDGSDSTTDDGNDSILQYSPETPPRPISPSLTALNRACFGERMTPPTNPPEKKKIEGTYPGQTLNFSSNPNEDGHWFLCYFSN